MDIQGRIYAAGNSSNLITFTCTDTVNAKWSGIRFNNTPSTNDTSVFQYCTIMYVDSGAINSLNFSKIKISNSVISNNYSTTGGAGVFVDQPGSVCSTVGPIGARSGRSGR